MRTPLSLASASLALALLASACGGASPSSTSTMPDASTTSIPDESTTSQAGGTLDSLPARTGVDPQTKTLTIGLLADQTGLFSPLISDVVAAQTVYWDALNAAGGIDGWTVEYLVQDTASNTGQHLEKYDEIRDQILAISISTGSNANLAALELYKQDSMLVFPLSWYSGWAFPRLDGRVMLEQNTNYCIEAMNILDFVNDMEGQRIALATFDDAYGQDAAAGVKQAIDFYGMDLVYDGTGAVVPGKDLTPVIQEIVNSAADWTFLATNPSLGAEILAGAARSGHKGMFTGSVPSYDFKLLDQPVSELYGMVYYQSAYNVGWGENTPGNNVMMTAVSGAFPDRRPSDGYITGWNGAVLMHRVLQIAIEGEDLTREGVVAAANSINEVDFGGSAPSQSYSGSPDEYVQRALAIYKPDPGLYAAAGGSDQKLSQGDGTTGSILVKSFFVGEMAEEYQFARPCFEG
ncbi:MAG: ABC transporter substrate-binding protein [Actinomycetia bacterium]|nr:ABC transporter substrate-binding protein [Actinomycetes bacterium]